MFERGLIYIVIDKLCQQTALQHFGLSDFIYEKGRKKAFFLTS